VVLAERQTRMCTTQSPEIGRGVCGCGWERERERERERQTDRETLDFHKGNSIEKEVWFEWYTKIKWIIKLNIKAKTTESICDSELIKA
jgi:hypothetical protein